MSNLIATTERMMIMSKAYAAIQMYFAHWQGLPPEFDLDAVYAKAIDEGLAAETPQAFSLAMLAFLASLQNGHTSYRPEPPIRQTYGNALGFELDYYEGQWVVVSSTHENLLVGSVIQTIEGENIEAFFQANKQYISASSEREARSKFYGTRYVLPVDIVQLGLATGQTVKLPRGLAADEATVASRWLVDNKIGYIAVKSFGDPEYEAQAIDSVRQFAQAQAIIIDVRGNSGGNTPDGLVKALMTKPYQYWAEATTAHLGLFKANGDLLRFFGQYIPPEQRVFLEASQPFFASSFQWGAAIEPVGETIFAGELVILLDRGTVSAGEDFVVPFKNNGRATLMGENTMGSTGQPYMHPFPQGMEWRVSTKRAFFPNGYPFEGIGIAPDITVIPTVADFQARRDVVLEAALDYLKI